MTLIKFPCKDDKSPGVSGWQTYKGAVNSAVVGYMIPEGVIVLDLDTYKGVACKDVEAVLGCSLLWHEAELQTTRNGGVHYAFRIPDGCQLRQGSDLFGVEGFDTRVSGKGYIASGEGYEDLTLFGIDETLSDPDCLPELGAEALAALDVGFEVVDEDDDFGLEEVLNNQGLGLEFDEIRAYVEALPDSMAGSGGDWLDIGMGIYHETGGSEEGWELFDEFSRKGGDSYDERMNRKRWESWDNQGGKAITFATVIKKAGGKNVIAQDRFEKYSAEIKGVDNINDLERIINVIGGASLGDVAAELLLKNVQAKYKELAGTSPGLVTLKKKLKTLKKVEGRLIRDRAGYLDDYVFLTSSGEYMHKETKTTMGPRAFDFKHSRSTPLGSEGVPQSATQYSSNYMKCVHNGMYAPMFDEFFNHDGVEYFNTYQPSRLQQVPMGVTDIVERVKAHIAHLLPKQEEQDLLINYFAHNVQRPGVKIQWAIILQGVEGDGKSFLGEMMQHVLGASNCLIINGEALDEKFTGWAEGNSMVFFEELKVDNFKKYEVINKIKPYITNPTVSVRKMRHDVYEAINTTNYVALSNYKDALPIHDNDRRYCVLFSQWQSKESIEKWTQGNKNYYPSLYNDMRRNAGEILDWLVTHKIPESFLSLKRAPETDAKNIMIGMSKGDDFMLVDDAIEEFECHDINSHVVNVTKLNKLVSESMETHYDNFPKTNRLKNILSDKGYHMIGTYKTTEERRNQRLYCKDDKKKAIEFREEDSNYVPF